MKAFSTRQMGSSHSVARQLRMVGWEAPPMEWRKLNTDCASRLLNGVTSCGGVLRDSIETWLLRDSTGTWLYSYPSNLGICSALDAQIWPTSSMIYKTNRDFFKAADMWEVRR
ncbi:hypothetical protein PVK06_002068 [Gossypium arboreum]|uniref:Uncharacterized protein n=1 Tax=Gossypium arboreum TaxID=29729 RepID=A0ABR0R2T5_GOSAR|nr:hypothetical protein PVK06_002068 [Gossypium arboreum]